ncbi:uncharacterized protein LOC129587851 [Paramacrobiotus metropolitanus]|uniref:uncharacterized protein LOC129587851 n=1 Tax=Paramacrobiotus metropolitanus TaxID=2943436 RepID=UPI002446325D|nr:uncharacterized protein LOC129587851 [Paramacrobiotus metropolitanus]
MSAEDKTLYHYCRPLLSLMRLGGLFYLPEKLQMSARVLREELVEDDYPLQRKHSRRYIFFKCWCWFAFACTVAYLGKFLWNFQSLLRLMGNPINAKNLTEFVFLLTFFNWFVQFTSWHFLMIRACKNKLFIKFFTHWEILRFNCADKNCNSFENYFKPRRNRLMFLTVLLVLTNIQAIWTPVLVDNGTFDAQRFVIYAGFQGYWHVVATGVMLIGHFFASFVYITPVMLLALLAYALYGEFRHLTRNMAKNINEDGELVVQSVEWYRQKHERLCTLVSLGDDIFSTIVLLAVFGSVIELFMLMFVVVDYSAKGKFTVITAVNELFWFLFHVTQLVVVIGMGIKVNAAAHSPLDILYKLDNNKLRPGEVHHLHTFLSKLNGNQIGFTASRLFTIDVSAVLSIVGMYITYQLLLFQLQMDLTSADEAATTNSGNTTTNITSGNL